MKNERIVHYENILNAFVGIDGLCNIRGAAVKLEELEAKAGQSFDWTEDFEERGNYQCKCRQCGCDFKGHKTRVLCKVCALPPCPDIEPIRKLAREVGYAVGEHGSKIRDYDLIAAPWTDEAVGNAGLIEHLCKGLNAKVVDGPSRKPCGRYAVCIQISDRWLKHIDLSIMPRVIERAPITLTPTDKYAISDNITIENRSKSDVVQDVFDEILERFDLRRRD